MPRRPHRGRAVTLPGDDHRRAALCGDPAVMVAIGMFSGYCRTLMTPMAANYNIVPAALLELPDKNAVIKAQAPTGVLLLVVNIVLLNVLMFR